MITNIVIWEPSANFQVMEEVGVMALKKILAVLHLMPSNMLEALEIHPSSQVC